jgi:hypothetical protein
MQLGWEECNRGAAEARRWTRRGDSIEHRTEATQASRLQEGAHAIAGDSEGFA